MADERNINTVSQDEAEPVNPDQELSEEELDSIAGGHTIKSPRDSASGQATGKRQHQSFSLNTDLDQ